MKENNRWVKVHKIIDWKIVDEEYFRNFKNKVISQVAYPSSVAFGSVYIQRRFRLPDREMVEQIAENPYMQYFIGYREYCSEKPFDPGLIVTFRKRLPEEVMNRIIERLFIEPAEKDDNDKGDKGSGCNFTSSGDNSAKAPEEQPNRGTLIIDATCIPANIVYQIDIELWEKTRR